MATRKLFLLPGDGIGPEAMAEVAELPLAETSEARGMRLSLKPPTQDET